MTEPLYEYTRGQGWALSLPGKRAVSVCGKAMLLFHRKPEVGEHYFNIGYYSEADGIDNWVNENGTPNWAFCIEHAASNGWYYEKPGFSAHSGCHLPDDNHFIVVKYV